MTQTPEQTTLQVIRDAIAGTEWENQVFIAGGYVRDELLGRQSKDIDLVVTRENGGIEFAQWITRRFKCFTLGNPVVFPRFGTAKFHLRGLINGVNLDNIQIECVMPRSETYTEGSRKPEVGFTSLKEDAKRRDFTINSLFRNVSTGELIDFTGGRMHIEQGIIQTGMAANIIFRDDPLRMLRAIRFAQRFKFMIHPRIIEAIKEDAPLIRTISKERIADELSKMLVGDHPVEALTIMQHTGLLAIILPELTDMIGQVQNEFHEDDAFDHTMKVVAGTPHDLATRMMALFHDIGKPRTASIGEDGRVHFYQHEEVGADMTRAILTELKFPTKFIDTVVHGVREHMRLKGAGLGGGFISDKALRKLTVDLGSDLNQILDLMHADNLAHHPDHVMPGQIPGIRIRLKELNNRPQPAKVNLPINGFDVMNELGIKAGPAVKAALGRVKDAWFGNPDLTRDEALEIIRLKV